MKLEYVSALLICLFLLCISVPNIFAEDRDFLTPSGNEHFIGSEEAFITKEKNGKKEVSILSDLQDRFYLGSAGLTKYGVDLISFSEEEWIAGKIKLRTGFNGGFTKNAAAGVQLIVSW